MTRIATAVTLTEIAEDLGVSRMSLVVSLNTATCLCVVSVYTSYNSFKSHFLYCFYCAIIDLGLLCLSSVHFRGCHQVTVLHVSTLCSNSMMPGPVFHLYLSSCIMYFRM